MNKTNLIIQKIINLFNVKDFEKVIETAQIFLKKNPENDFVLNLLGLTFQQIKKFDNAEVVLMRALQVNSNNVSVLNNLGNNFKYKFEFEKSKEFYINALKKNPDHTQVLLNYGNLQFILNKNLEALELFEKALLTNNKIIPIHLNLAITHQSLGNFKKAKEHLYKINEIDPKFTRADKMISLLEDYNKDDTHLKLMIKKLEKNDLSDNQKIYLYFGIGKALEDKKNFKEAFDYIKLGNELKRSTSNYSIKKDKELVNKIKDQFNDFNFDTNKEEKNFPSPIFILGMPRSGTSLIEQIISSHENVEGLGELNLFNKIAENEFVKGDKYDLEHMINNYYKLLGSFDLKKENFTDKTLLNFFWIGFIKICFPSAKIINCSRNPKDNCISIYKNLFDHEGAWCYDETELTEYYKLYQDLIIYWKKKIPNFIYDVKYENIINNSENEIKNMIKFCDLKWDKQCLSFNENKTAIKTLSVNQVRKKIYSSSVNSFDNYKKFSSDLFKDL